MGERYLMVSGLTVRVISSDASERVVDVERYDVRREERVDWAS